jgi:hypothetical protein
MSESETGASPKSPLNYFSNPIYALSAVLDHGIRIAGHNPENIIDWMSAFRHEQWGSYQWYIHPDDEHLLEPQDGDKDEDGFAFCAKTKKWWREYGFRAEINGPLMGGKERSTTARRNGKPFFWPEREAV